MGPGTGDHSQHAVMDMAVSRVDIRPRTQQHHRFINNVHNLSDSAINVTRYMVSSHK